MISLKTKIETAVRMGANCGSLDLTSDDTKTSIDLDDADIQALHDGLCDTERLAWVRSDNKNLQSLNAGLCGETRQYSAMLRVANGSVADLQKVTDTLRSELANARANYEYSSADRDKERKRADQAEAKLRKQESLEDDLQIAERLSNGLNGELQATREKLIHAEILAKRWFDRFQVVDAKLASYTDDRGALATAVEGYEFQVESLIEQVRRLESTNAELSAAAAQMTEGVPCRWLRRDLVTGVVCVFDHEPKAGESFEITPLFRAAQRAPQADELAREKRMREETRLDLVKAQEERDALKARVKALEGSGETVAWDVVGDDGMAIACDDESHADKILDEHGGRKRALFEAPQPAAIGVTDEIFGVFADFGAERFLYDFETSRSLNIQVGTRAEAEGAVRRLGARHIKGTRLVRLIDADAPVVDVAAIRKALRTLRCVGYGHMPVENLDEIAAAIGEKGG